MAKKLKCWKKEERGGIIDFKKKRKDGRGLDIVRIADDHLANKNKPHLVMISDNPLSVSGKIKNFSKEKEAEKFAYKYMEKHDTC